MRQKLTAAWFAACLGCSTSSTNTAPPAIPCAPGNSSWGCRSAEHTSPNYVGTQPTPPVQGAPTNRQTTAPSPGSWPTAPGNLGQSPPSPTVSNGTTTAAPPIADDPIGRVDIAYQRQRVTTVYGELIAALDADARSRVERLPLTFDPDRNNVNAFASCSRTGKATIAITDGLLVLTAYLVQLRATDEVSGSNRLDEYVLKVARQQTQNTPPLAPEPSWVSVEPRLQAAKLARQSQLNDEVFAFVIAHELGHHYLNHLPCTSVLPLDASEMGILLTGVVPAFNQPAEMAADVAGTRNVLLAGQRRTNMRLSENGALLTMKFFGALDRATPGDVFNFERTHPPPSLREPIITSTAQTFRATSGVRWPW